MKLKLNDRKWVWLLVLLLWVAVASVTSRPLIPGAQGEPGLEDPLTPLTLSPGLFTQDQITHNLGNIATTVDNFGYIGGYQYYGLPSGEFPRNSGHDYLAEIRYWMGAVTAAGDTLVANTYDDFQAMPMPVNGEDDYKIYLSSDPDRFFAYDPLDTVGLAAGNPAYGWRVWKASQGSYVYNENYSPLQTAYIPGGPTSLQESHYRFNDVALGSPLLGLELTQTIMQWNYCYNEDFMFVVLEITNTSEEDYSEFAFGLYIDIDVGGPDGTGENGRLEDLVAFDETENLAWTYDSRGWDPGWGRNVATGIMGTKYLETPDNIGMTAFRTDDWAIVTDIEDENMFDLINSEQFDTSLPPTDQFYIQCTRGIDLTAGKTVRVVFALVAGEDEEDFMDNASLAQDLYDNYFIGPQPPATPTLTARSGNGKVYLNWNDSAEVSVDPLSGEQDFVGYKLYRSEDQGQTWGQPNYNTGNNCLVLDYRTIGYYAVATAGDLIPHTFVDTGLYNGVEYWYCLAAFDAGDEATGIDALQSGFGVAGEVANVIAITPRADPAGYYEASTTVEHQYTGAQNPSEGTVTPIIFDDAEVTGEEYRVVFEDTPGATYWHLINNTTGDTILANQTRTDGEPDMFETAEGIRVMVTNAERAPADIGQTSFAGGDTTLAVAAYYGPSIPALTGYDTDIWSDSPFRSTYELRYTGDSTYAPWILEYWYGPVFEYWVPFEAWNTKTNQRVSLAVYDFAEDGVWGPEDPLAIVEYPYDPDVSLTDEAFPVYYSWLIGLDDEIYAPQAGDVLTVEGAPMNGPDDIFVFRPDGVNAGLAGPAMKDIKVVPNPYFGRNSARVETESNPTVIAFKKIPDKCTIRIYTLAGDLVRTLQHDDGTGEAEWNLLSASGLQIASGIYLFHVESEYGDHLGRFAVIK